MYCGVCVYRGVYVLWCVYTVVVCMRPASVWLRHCIQACTVVYVPWRVYCTVVAAPWCMHRVAALVVCSVVRACAPWCVCTVVCTCTAVCVRSVWCVCGCTVVRAPVVRVLQLWRVRTDPHRMCAMRIPGHVHVCPGFLPSSRLQASINTTTGPKQQHQSSTTSTNTTPNPNLPHS
jgi:hypothetical protein